MSNFDQQKPITKTTSKAIGGQPMPGQSGMAPMSGPMPGQGGMPPLGGQAQKPPAFRGPDRMAPSIIGEDLTVTGNVLSRGEVQVDGQIQGDVHCSSLIVGEKAQITGGIVDGPLAFDDAISKQAAADKGIVSKVAGDADILVVPEIESGNILAKQLTFLGHADAAGIVLGARVPIILTSRADNLRTRLLSCAMAVLLAAARREGRLK